MGEGGYPDPGQAADLGEFIAALGRLRMWAGAPAYRTLAKRVGPAMRPPQEVSASTVMDVFRTNRRRLDFDLVVGIVRALGVPEAELDRWRSACARVHREAKAGGPVGVFRQLPHDIASFTGRDAEQRRLLDAVAANDGSAAPTVVISAIEGMAGVGKTQLAVHTAHELVRNGRYADVQLYVNLRSFDPDQAPADPGVVLDGFLRQLEVPAHHIPESLAERSAMFRDRMHGRDALILLDDAADAAQVRELIPASPSCLVLITSRRSLADLEGAVLHPLDVFSLDEALALLAKVVGADRIAAEPEAAEQIARACGFLPLALSIVAARLRSRPAWSLAELVRRLDAGLAAVSLKGRALRSVFDLSYQGLPEPQRRVFRLLGLHPGTTFTAASVAALAAVDVGEAEEILESLLDEHLLQQRTADRFTLHDLLRLYAAELADEEPEPDDDAAVARLAHWYVNAAYRAAAGIKTPVLPEPVPDLLATVPEFEDYDDALAWFEDERENLAAVQEDAALRGMHESVWQVSLMQKQFYMLRRYHRDFVAAQHLAVAATRAASNRAMEARMLSGLGAAFWRSNLLDEAGDAYRETMAVYRDLGDRNGEGRTLCDFGVLSAGRDDVEGAVSLFAQALPLLDGQTESDLRGRAMCLMNLGAMQSELGRTREALDGSLQALEIFREIADVASQAMVIGNIGDYHRKLGELDPAFERCREALELSRAIGDEYLEASALVGLGDVAGVTGRFDDARRYLGEALAQLEAIGHPRAAEAREKLAALDGAVDPA